MNNKQVLVYGFLESTSDLKSIFVGQIHYWIISLLHNQAQEQEIMFLLTIFIGKHSLRKENMGQRNFKKPFKFHNFSEIFYCGMTRLRNTSLGVFLQCQYTRTILRNKNMGQSLFKKHSKFQNFDEIFYCGMTGLRSTSLGVFI